MEPETSRKNYTKGSRQPLTFNRYRKCITRPESLPHNVTAPTKFGVIQRDRLRRYVIVIACDIV